MVNGRLNGQEHRTHIVYENTEIKHFYLSLGCENINFKEKKWYVCLLFFLTFKWRAQYPYFWVFSSRKLKFVEGVILKPMFTQFLCGDKKKKKKKKPIKKWKNEKKNNTSNKNKIDWDETPISLIF